ncbi:MAG: PadR family transcriptional regulator [Thermoplasmata archaeon]|nr:PadR family transcriptional regulator [Thermoplasmata archaeon]
MNGFPSLDNKYAKSILIRLLNERESIPITKFLDIASSYYALKNTISDMEKDGLVKIEEKVLGRKMIFVSLTEKGRAVAEQLKRAEQISKLSPEELERFKNMRGLIHINIYKDHITVMDVHMGEKRIANIYARPRGDEIYFWCDLHEDVDCYHIEYMFADPDLSDFIHNWIDENGFKLPKKYQKYVDKYW